MGQAGMGSALETRTKPPWGSPRMGRPLPIALAGALYHVTARSNEYKPVYRGAHDRRRFLERRGSWALLTQGRRSSRQNVRKGKTVMVPVSK